jgi:hypothetical protein
MDDPVRMAGKQRCQADEDQAKNRETIFFQRCLLL